MPGKKSKSKGKRFENKIASIIRDSLELNKDECHRSSSSGTTDWDYGDIYIKDFPLVIECKFHNTFDIKQLIPKITNTINKWLDQLNDCVDKYYEMFKISPIRVLVISKPYYPIFFMFYEEDIKIFDYEKYNFIKLNELVIFYDVNIFKDFLREIYNKIKKGE